MSKHGFLLSLLSLMLFAGFSCKKEDNLAPGFDMFFQQSFSIPAGIGIFDVHHFQLRNIPSNWAQYLDQHGKTAEDIQRIITVEASLTGVFGDVNMGVIDRISLRLYDESSPNEFVEIAYRDPTPLDALNSLPLIPSLADSKRFFTKPRFSADVVIHLRNTTADVSDVRLDLRMRAVL